MNHATDNAAVAPLHVYLLIAVVITVGMADSSGESTEILEPRFIDAKSFAQIYTLTAITDDSSMVQVQFVLTNLGIRNRNGAVKVLRMARDGKPTIWNEKFRDNQWRYESTGITKALHIGNNHIAIAEDQTRLICGRGPNRISVTFDKPSQAIDPPFSYITHKERFMDYAIAQAWMPALIGVGETDPAITKGYAMLEMSRSTSLPSDICRGWITFRGYTDSSVFHANLRLPPDKDSSATGWTWSGPPEKPTVRAGVILVLRTPKGLFKKPVVEKVVDSGGAFTIIPRSYLFRYSFIDELGPVLGAIVKLVVGAPVVYYYRAEVHRPGKIPVPGVLEYMRIE